MLGSASLCKFRGQLNISFIIFEEQSMYSTTEPKIDNRTEQIYAGIRQNVTPQEMGGNIIPELIDELAAWLKQHGIEPQGAPFMRYYVIDMANTLDVEIGFSVAKPVTGDDRVKPGVLPAGRYAS